MKKIIYQKLRASYFNFYKEGSKVLYDKKAHVFKEQFKIDDYIKNYEAIGPFVYFISDYSRFNFTHVGGNTELLLGYKNEEIEGKGFGLTYKLVSLKDIVRLLRGASFFWKHFKSTPIDDRKYLRVNYTLTYKRKDGSTFEGFQQNRPVLFNEKGDPIYFLNIITDISDLKSKLTPHEHYILNVKNPLKVEKFQIKLEDSDIFDKIVSPAEFKVLDLIAEGLRTKEIAEKLFLSEHTINIHRKNLLQKLDCSSSSQLVKRAMMAGIL